MKKTIIKLEYAKFKIINHEVPDSILELNFKPLIHKFALRRHNDFLLHWQAKPKGYREWGIYSLKDDNYYSIKSITLNRVLQETLQLDDATADTVPSAVIQVKNAELTITSHKNNAILSLISN